MFGIFRKRPPSAEQLSKLAAAATEDVKAKWINFNQTLRCNTEIPLSQQIDVFAQPLQLFFQNTYPVLYKGPATAFWLIVFTAISESGTHPTDAVNTAYKELQKKYASG